MHVLFSERDTVCKLSYTKTIFVICNSLDNITGINARLSFVKFGSIAVILSLAICNRRERFEPLQQLIGSKMFVQDFLRDSVGSRTKTGALFNHSDTHYRGQTRAENTSVGLCNKTKPFLHTFCSFTCWSIQIQASHDCDQMFYRKCYKKKQNMQTKKDFKSIKAQSIYKKQII